MLIYFDWNSQKLEEKYFSDVDKYRKLCGISDGTKAAALEDGDCAICFEEVKVADTASLAWYVLCGYLGLP